MPDWSSADLPDLGGRTFVVTGANSGIGLETVRALAGKGARVVLACRDTARGEAAADTVTCGEVSVAELDLADLASVESFAKGLLSELPRLDGLIHNAGVMMPPLTRTADGFELQFGTNFLGPFALTGRLLPLLNEAPQARVVTVSSLVHWYGWIDFANLNAEKRYSRQLAYNQSKLAGLVFMHTLNRRLRRTGSPVVSVGAHPGITRSQLARHDTFLRLAMPLVGQPTEMGALPTLMAAAAPQVDGGAYIGPRGFLRGTPGAARSRPRVRHEETGDRLWTVAQELTGVSYQ